MFIIFSENRSEESIMPRRNDVVLSEEDISLLLEAVGILKGKQEKVKKEEAQEYLQSITGLRETTLSNVLFPKPVVRKSLRAIHEGLTRIAGNNFRIETSFLARLIGEEKSAFMEVVPSQSTQSEFSVQSEMAVEKRLITLLEQSSKEGIIGVYRRGEEFHSRIIAAVSQAQKFVYTSARTHRHMLVEDGGLDGWLLETLTHQLKTTSLKCRLLLADGFDEDSGYRRELKAYFTPSTAESHRHANRDTVIGMTKVIGERVGESDFQMRLTPLALTYSMLITETALFFEPYLPSQTGGANIIFEVRGREPRSLEKDREWRQTLYATFLQDFTKQYNEATSLYTSLNAFYERRYGGKASSENVRQQILEQSLLVAKGLKDHLLPVEPEQHFLSF
jgi:hypothetical protein